MTWSYSYTPEIWPAIVTLVLMVHLGQCSWRRGHIPGARLFAVACAVCSPWIVGVIMEISAVAIATQVFWRQFQAVWPLAAVATNLAKAGQTIPLKFYAETTSGPVTDLASVDLSIISTGCESLDEGVDAIDSCSTGASVLLENLGGGYYQYNWKTMKGDTGCRLVTLALPETYTADALVAAFKFRK